MLVYTETHKNCQFLSKRLNAQNSFIEKITFKFENCLKFPICLVFLSMIVAADTDRYITVAFNQIYRKILFS